MKDVCICACSHESAEPTQPYESSAASAEHRRKICFGFQEDITGKEYWHPFKGCSAHISSQLYNAFILLSDLKYFLPLPHHVWRETSGPRLASRSPGLLSQVELPPLPYPPWVALTRGVAQRNVPVPSDGAEWVLVVSCSVAVMPSLVKTVETQSKRWLW